MDEDNKTLFSRKRKVIDGSKRRGNVVGFFTSRKMDCAIHYQSLAEHKFYCYLELDPRVVQYYVQPVNVPVAVGAKGDDSRHWPYTPDVLVIYCNDMAELYEVKSEREEPDSQGLKRRIAAMAYCRQRGWRFEVVYPNEWNPTFVDNIVFLNRFTHPHPGLAQLEEEIMAAVKKSGGKLENIAKKVAVRTGTQEAYIITHIYHLLAVGELRTNMKKPIGPGAVIRKNSEISEREDS